MHGDVERRIMRAEDREPKRDEAVAVGEGPRQQPLDLAAWMRHLREVPLARFRLGLWRTVEEGSADAALDQAAHRSVGVIRRRIVVAPIHQRRGAAIDLVQRADQRRDVDILGPEYGREPGMHAAEIFQQRPVGGIAAQSRLPGVHMRVDQAGDDDAPGAVHNLRFGRAAADVDRWAHVDDAVALDQHVASAEIADRVIHADDDRGFDQRAPHGIKPPL
ncbi:hypothetical protein ACVWW4_002104 [Bradyrhizobium sp. LB7.1]